MDLGSSGDTCAGSSPALRTISPREDGVASSGGVVPYASSHFASAESELVVPSGHGGVAHPKAVAELKRIIRVSLAGAQARGVRTGAAAKVPAAR